MRERLKYILSVMLSAVFAVSAGTEVWAAAETASQTVVDTIVLNMDIVGDAEVPTDLSWKTKQDKGQWLNEFKIAEDVDSLILVINNLDKEDPHALPKQGKTADAVNGTKSKKKEKKKDITGKSRLSYFSKHGENEWQEIFSVDCFISGNEFDEKEAVYGVYRPDCSFGEKENPGSLLSYKQLDSFDYWIFDPSDENFGNIYTTSSESEKPAHGAKMEKFKTFCNYGMVLKPESEDFGYSALVAYCQQNETADGPFCGIQISELYMRMLIQSIDENTRIVITDGYDSLSEIGE